MPKPTTLSLTEKWDLPMLFRIANLGASDPKIDSLLHVTQDIQCYGDVGLLTVRYKASKAAPLGRLYAHPSLQSTSGWIRRLCAHKFYHDVDIENCFPTVLRQVAVQHGLLCPALAQYVEHRQDVFRRARRVG